jgi:N-acetylglucosaminyl-diphospho-decaprenol L-rhamnosyltransferase
MVSIVILNYKVKGLLKNCVKSIYANTHGLDYEIIVVDNGSDDGVGEMVKKRFPKIKFIQNKDNLGFGAGNNVGIREAQGKYVAVINPDTSFKENALKKMYDFMEDHGEVGIVAPQLINPNGSVQYTRCRFPEFLMPIYRRTPLKKLGVIDKKIKRYLTLDKDYSQSTKTDWIFGAILFIRKESLDQVGLYDERFFLGFEDTDLCRRFWEKNYEVWYYSKTQVVHYPHRFSRKKLLSKSVKEHNLSWIKYFKKYGFKNPESQI